jgi:hypothetical protein
MVSFTERDHYDVFISYAHADNEPYYDFKHGPVTTFRHNLKIALSRKLDRNAKIWMDLSHLPGNQPLTPAILDGLSKTAVIIVIASTAISSFRVVQAGTQEVS